MKSRKSNSAEKNCSNGYVIKNGHLDVIVDFIFFLFSFILYSISFDKKKILMRITYKIHEVQCN